MFKYISWTGLNWSKGQPSCSLIRHLFEILCNSCITFSHKKNLLSAFVSSVWNKPVSTLYRYYHITHLSRSHSKSINYQILNPWNWWYYHPLNSDSDQSSQSPPYSVGGAWEHPGNPCGWSPSLLASSSQDFTVTRNFFSRRFTRAFLIAVKSVLQELPVSLSASQTIQWGCGVCPRQFSEVQYSPGPPQGWEHQPERRNTRELNIQCR